MQNYFHRNFNRTFNIKKKLFLALMKFRNSFKKEFKSDHPIRQSILKIDETIQLRKPTKNIERIAIAIMRRRRG